MSYQLEREEAPGDGVRRIAHEQVAGALDELARVDEVGVVEAIHSVRKRCKQLRGLIRLVPRELGKEYGRANATYRDAARELSVIRDAQALLGTFDEMVAASELRRAQRTHLKAVRAGLAARAQAADEQVAARSENLERAVELLARGEARIDGWRIRAEGWDALAGGLGATYGRGRVALAEVRAAPSAPAFHEWRKRAKYAWYHARLLGPMTPAVLGPAAERFHDLSDALGDAHDLAVLTEQLGADVDAFGGAGAVSSACDVVEGHRLDLERRAVSLGARLYAEPPKRFVARMGAYWDLWHDLGDELAAGELAALHGSGSGAGD